MTVGIAAICRWIYSETDPGWAVITASDQMLTNGDVEYEPPQRKLSAFGRSAILLVSGEIQVHSDAIKATQRHLLSTPESDVRTIAEIYASNIRKMRADWAAQTYLSAYGLDQDSFLQKQKYMDADVVRELSSKIESYHFDIQAIVAGINPSGDAEICNIDGFGMSACQTDVGFVSIGIGAGHANLKLMATGYSKHFNLYHACLAKVYAAKKRSEVAPGVGTATDLILITRGGWEYISDELLTLIESIYQEWVEAGNRITEESIKKLIEETPKLAKRKELEVQTDNVRVDEVDAIEKTGLP
jgi:hypothetical protein